MVIPTRAASPGAQMVFVRLADGRELLFAGDTAPLAFNWEQLRARSRLLGDWREHDDRKAVYAWLMTIRRLKEQARQLEVVPAHDGDWVNMQFARGTLVRHFSG